jgi:hypothetical protein
MGSWQTSFEHHALILWAVLVAAVCFLALWVLRLHAANHRQAERLSELLDGVAEGTTAAMLVEYLRTVRSTAAAVEHMKSEHARVASLMPSVVRHVGLVRFSPFHDTGGDQSFALALLDGRADGVVITGLHSRTDSRLYAKPIEGGASSYVLTSEEREAMSRALEGTRARVAVEPVRPGGRSRADAG